MPDLRSFPDIEDALEELLVDLAVDDDHIDTVTPSDLQARLANGAVFITVVRTGGPSDFISDYPRVEIDVFALERDVAMSCALAVQQRLIAFPHRLSNCVIDRVDTDSGPFSRPWANQSTKRVGATYIATTRR